MEARGTMEDRGNAARETPIVAKLARPMYSANSAPLNSNHQPQRVSDEPLGKIGRNKTAILTTVFLVAGILGLPLVYYSPVFSRKEKAFWTVIVLIYTYILFYILYRVAAWSYASITAVL